LAIKTVFFFFLGFVQNFYNSIMLVGFDLLL